MLYYFHFDFQYIYYSLSHSIVPVQDILYTVYIKRQIQSKDMDYLAIDDSLSLILYCQIRAAAKELEF